LQVYQKDRLPTKTCKLSVSVSRMAARVDGDRHW
jgi:hypothetical protein